MNNIETRGLRPEYEVNMDTVFARQDQKAQEIMESNNMTWASKIDSLAEMQNSWRSMKDVLETEQGN